MSLHPRLPRPALAGAAALALVAGAAFGLLPHAAAGDPAAEKTEPAPKPPAEKATPAPVPAPAEEASPPLIPATGSAGDLLQRERLDLFIPTGRSHRGLRYPVYERSAPDPAVVDPTTGWAAGVDAPLESLFESDLVTRLDDNHVQFDHAKWQQFTEDSAMTLNVERGIYDLRNDILMSNRPIRIESSNYVISADQMLHDRKTGVTRLTGRVQMSFYQELPAETAPEAAPAAITPDKTGTSAPTPGTPAPETPAQK